MNQEIAGLPSSIQTELILNEFDDFIIESIQTSKLTISAISTDTRISRTVLTKIKQGEKGKTFNLTPYKKFRLFSCFYTSQDLDKKYSQFSRIFSTREESSKWDFELSNSGQFHETFTRELSDPISIAIFTMSLNDGVSSIDIKERFGSNGIEVANKLVDKKLIFYSKNSYFALNTTYVDLPKKGLKTIVTSLSENYNPMNCGQGKNYINFRIDKVSPSALLKIQEIHASFSESVSNILEQQESKGHIPFYSINQMDIFSK